MSAATSALLVMPAALLVIADVNELSASSRAAAQMIDGEGDVNETLVALGSPAAGVSSAAAATTTPGNRTVAASIA